MKQTTSSTNLVDMAIRATFELQYNSRKAARFVCEQIPTATFDEALEVVNQVVRPSKAKEKA